MARRKQRVKISCEKLRKMYNADGLSQADIATLHDTTRQTISNKMKACHIEARSGSEARDLAIDKGKLYGDYVDRLEQAVRIALSYRPLETDPMQVAIRKLVPNVVDEFLARREELYGN